MRNASWIIGCKIAQSVLAFILTLLTARFLGPDNYGLISYATSLSTFILPVVQLGLNATLVYELVKHPEEEGKTLGTALLMSIVSAILSIIGIGMFSAISNGGDITTVVVCVLYSISLIFQAIELIIYWYQSKYLSKYTAIVSLMAYVLISIYKIYILATNKSIYWFAIVQAFDYAIIAFSLIFIYKKLGGQHFSFSVKTAKRLLSKSKYYILSGLMVNVFAQTDRIMLKLMIGNAETGYYSVAATCAGLVSFVFSAIIDSFRPDILEKKKVSEDEFENSVIRLYSIVVYFALAVSVFIFVFSGIIIPVLYGDAYTASIPVLRILVWYISFSYFGGAKDVWILAENRQKYLLLINSSGAVINILLNLVLIPILHSNGAALASLITQIFTNIVMIFLIKPLRRNNYLLIKALNPKVLIKLIKKN